MENGLQSRVLRLGGVHHGGWWTPIFVFFDAADRMAIREKSYYQAKVSLIRNYQGLKELDATVVNALIDKILVKVRQ